MAPLAVRSLLLCLLLASPALASAGIAKLNSSSPLFGIEFPPFNTAAVAVTGCDTKLAAAEEAALGEQQKQPASPSPSLKLHMSRRTSSAGGTRKESLLDLADKDAVRIETMHRRAARSSGDRAPASSSPRRALSERVVATVESGVAVGSGEYLMDVYVGTPPRRFRMIMDTGSDLNWLQCAPCLDCFEQRGPVFDPAVSSSYRQRHLRRPTLRPRCGTTGGLGVPPSRGGPLPVLLLVRGPVQHHRRPGPGVLDGQPHGGPGLVPPRRRRGVRVRAPEPRPLPRRGGAAGPRPGPAVVRVPAPRRVRAHLLVLPGGPRQRRR